MFLLHPLRLIVGVVSITKCIYNHIHSFLSSKIEFYVHVIEEMKLLSFYFGFRNKWVTQKENF